MGVALLPFMALSLVTEAPAQALPTTLYAYVTGAASPSGCPAEATPANGCSLLEALTQGTTSGDIIALATPGGSGSYYGNWP